MSRFRGKRPECSLLQSRDENVETATAIKHTGEAPGGLNEPDWRVGGIGSDRSEPQIEGKIHELDLADLPSGLG
jgi:hypothetical protein